MLHPLWFIMNFVILFKHVFSFSDPNFEHTYLNKASQNVPLVKFTCSRISASFLVGYMSSAYV